MHLRVGQAHGEVTRIALLKSTIAAHTDKVNTGLGRRIAIFCWSTNKGQIIGAGSCNGGPYSFVDNEDLDVVEVGHEKKCQKYKQTGDLSVQHAVQKVRDGSIKYKHNHPIEQFSETEPRGAFYSSRKKTCEILCIDAGVAHSIPVGH